MRVRPRWLAFVTALAALVSAGGIQASAQAPAALSGEVSSAREGLMEGVVVSARKDGSTITVSVVTDRSGHFSFPASRLPPGHYALSIRAVGYDLTGKADVTLKPAEESKVSLKLAPTHNLSRACPAPMSRSAFCCSATTVTPSNASSTRPMMPTNSCRSSSA